MGAYETGIFPDASVFSVLCSTAAKKISLHCICIRIRHFDRNTSYSGYILHLYRNPWTEFSGTGYRNFFIVCIPWFLFRLPFHTKLKNAESDSSVMHVSLTLIGWFYMLFLSSAGHWFVSVEISVLSVFRGNFI